MKRTKLSVEEIKQRLESLPDWRLVDGKISRTFATGNFLKGLDLVSKVAEIAEEMNHHPDVTLTYPKVRFDIFTHDVGGITEVDFALAEKIEKLA